MKPETIIKKLKERGIHLQNEDLIEEFLEQEDNAVGFLPMIGQVIKSFKDADQISLKSSLEESCYHCGWRTLSLLINIRKLDYNSDKSFMDSIHNFRDKDDYLTYHEVLLTTDFQNPKKTS